MTNQQLDDKVKKMVKNTKITYPEDYEEYVQQILNDLPEQVEPTNRVSEEKQGRSFRWVFRPAMVVVVLLLLFISIPVGAMVYGYMGRMATMKDEQVKKYQSDIQKSNSSEDSYSRELTAEESDRIQKLQASYEAGEQYPKKELITIEMETQIQKDRVCFLTATSMFYFPETALTDEDLLELIDFYYKRDYSLTKEYTEKKESNKSQEEKKKKLSKAEAMKLAEETVQTIYGVDVTTWKRIVDNKESLELKKKYYHIEFRESKVSYFVDINLSQGKFYKCFKAKEDEDHYGEGFVIAQKQIEELYQKVTSLYEKLGEELETNLVNCEYMKTPEGELAYGVIHFVFRQKNKQGYVITYSLKTKEFFQIEWLDNMSSYDKIIKQSAKQQKVKRQRIKME